MLTVHKCSDTGLFGHLSNSNFSSLQFKKEITSDSQLFFQSIPHFMSIPETQQNIRKIFFDFEITAFELFALDTPFYWVKILFIGCQYGKK